HAGEGGLVAEPAQLATSTAEAVLIEAVRFEEGRDDDDGWETVTSRGSSGTSRHRRDSDIEAERTNRPNVQPVASGGSGPIAIADCLRSPVANRYDVLTVERTCVNDPAADTPLPPSPVNSHISYETAPSLNYPERDLLLEIMDNLSDGTREML